METQAEYNVPTPVSAGGIIELQRYRCHKTVHALKIAGVIQAPADQERMHASGDWLLVPEDGRYGPICVGHDEFIRKHNPKPGDYWVQYEDGYCSVSPREAFESGYTRESDWGLRRSQETKYTIGRTGRLVHRETGQAIPDEEPVMVFRGKDRRAVDAIAAYLLVIQDPAHRAKVEALLRRFQGYAEAYPRLVREPN